jgi:hypothetical protein
MGESMISAQVVRKKSGPSSINSVADIIETQQEEVIAEWLSRVEKEPDLASIHLSFEERTGHLPQLLHDVIRRLRINDGSKAPISKAASNHGDLRCKQGYTVCEGRFPIVVMVRFENFERQQRKVWFFHDRMVARRRDPSKYDYTLICGMPTDHETPDCAGFRAPKNRPSYFVLQVVCRLVPCQISSVHLLRVPVKLLPSLHREGAAAWAGVVIVRLDIAGIVDAPGLHRRPRGSVPVRRQLLQPVGDALDVGIVRGVALWVVEKMCGEQVEKLEQVAADEFNGFIGRAAGERPRQCMLPSVLCAARIRVFHAAIIGQTFGTSKLASLAVSRIVAKPIVLCASSA